MKKEQLEELWELYKEYCAIAMTTQCCDSDKASDFLGWLEKKTK